ncbi:hypothetical protein ACP70R_019721 [Stipagrostis hirtigluma subsp. patula]
MDAVTAAKAAPAAPQDAAGGNMKMEARGRQGGEGNRLGNAAFGAAALQLVSKVDTVQYERMQHGMPFAASANSSSHGSESSIPCYARQQEKQPINIEESSGSGEEEGRRAPRINWSEEENNRLLSAWLHNSVDPINGIDKKGEAYWKDVARDFNNSMPKNGHKRTIRQLKTHWGGVKKDIAKFCGAYSRAKSGWSSGHSDDMIMDKARLLYKNENQDKPFTLEYMWKDLKDQPKWRRVLAQEENKNKRTKNSESGAYTSSSNQDTETESVRKEKRPEGQKAAKARMKGKGKNIAPSPFGEQPTQDMVLFHEAITSKAKAQEALARTKKLEAYIKLEEKDTSNYSEARLKAHEALLEKLALELAQD